MDKRPTKVKNVFIGLAISLCAVILVLAVLEFGSRMLFGSAIQYIYPSPSLWLMAPSQEGFTLPGKPLAAINGQGFRGYPFPKEKAASQRIAFLGDSYAMGYGVGDNETIPVLLQHYLNARRKNAEVLNFGVPGYGHQQMVSLYKGIAQGFNPDVVILITSEFNLLRQPPQEGSENILQRFIRFILRRSTFAALMKPKFENFRWLIFGNAQQPSSEEYQLLWENDKLHFDELTSLIQKNNQSLVIIPYIEKEQEKEFLQWFYDWGNKKQNVFIVPNIFEAMEEYQKKHPAAILQIPGDGHPTSLANNITAGVVGQLIIEKKLLG